MVALRGQGNWRWEGLLGTPLGLVHWKRASSPVEAGTSGFLPLISHFVYFYSCTYVVGLRVFGICSMTPFSGTDCFRKEPAVPMWGS